MSLTNLQIPILKSDIQANPIFSSLITTGNDQGIANVYNVISSGFSCLLTNVPQYNVFFWAASGTYGIIQSGANTNGHPAQSACIAALSLIGNSNTVFNTGDANQVNLFLKLRTEGIITQAQYTSLGAACKKNPCSSGELLFGVGTIVTNSDVSLALRGY